VAVSCAGVGFQLLQLAYSIWKRDENRDLTGDPWDGRTLEWASASPVQEYNFAVLPAGNERDAFWAMKHAKTKAWPESRYQDIRVPANTPAGLFVGGFALLAGFGFVWHIWWLVVLTLLGALITIFTRTLRDDDGERTILAAEVAATERQWQARRQSS
jgi:cytochrome o ubiquinol oxidase subunit 1